jgi:CSLREA domain-containing protein
LVAGLAVSGSMLLASSAQAAAYTVTNTTDVNDGACTPSLCSLRDAVNAANLDTTPDTITFAPGVTGTITLGSTLDITGSGGLTITGPGASALTISGNNAVQDINISSANGTPVTLTGLTVTDGNTSNRGGAIGTTSNSPDLSLVNDTISNSTSTSDGGGVYTDRGPLLVSGSTISGNTSTDNGGGVASYAYPVVITNSQFLANTSTNRSGGGLSVDSEEAAVRISGSTFSGNQASEDGGAIRLDSKYGANQITGSTLTGNTAGDDGGADLASVFGTTKVVDSTVSNNHAAYVGGLGVYSYAGQATIEGTTISGNAATATHGSDGGLLVLGYGSTYGGPVTAQVIDSTISGNTAPVGAGAAAVDVKYTGNDHPVASFSNSTIAGNVASQHAGGLYLEQTRYTNSDPYVAPLVELNSTIVAGNTAAGINDDLERGSAATTGSVHANYSLIQAPGTVPLVNNHTLIGINPQLGPLANNGGPTQTMLPSGISPVIDQGKAAPGLLTDQRGDPRTVDTGIPNAPGGDGTDIGSVELPASSVVVPPTPTAGTTLSIRGAGLNFSSRPLLVGNQTPVTCAVKTGVLHSCVIEIRTGNNLLGSGEVTSTGGTSSLTTTVQPTSAGLKYLKSRPLGAAGSATLTASQTGAGSPIVMGNVTFLPSNMITLGLGKRSSKLSSGVVSELGRVAKLLTGARSYTCTAYTSPGKNSVGLTKSVAGSACSRLKHDGLKGTSRAVGKGSTGAIASNKTKKGQVANRRLSISFKF